MESPFGALTLVASEAGLREVRWPGRPPPRPGTGGGSAGEAPAVLKDAAEQLVAYFAQRRRSFDLPLDPVGTDFQVAAWMALADIPYGTTTTYGSQARRVGRPKAARAVGAANSRNPIPVVLPCHRVVGANGDLTGFALGLDVKRALLDLERGRPRGFSTGRL